MRLSFFPFASSTVLLAAALALAGCGNSGSTTTTSGATGGTGGATGGTSTGGAGATGGSGGTGGTGTTSSTNTFPEGEAIPTVMMTYDLAAGAAPLPKPGFQAGYGFMGDGSGTYQVIWTGNTSAGNPAIAFTGTIWTAGKFSNVTPGCLDGSCTLEESDKVVGPGPAKGGGQYITFDATSTDDTDGIEFTIDKEPLYLDLFYDGKRQTPRVIYSNADKGGAPSNPLEIPFALTTK